MARITKDPLAEKVITVPEYEQEYWNNENFVTTKQASEFTKIPLKTLQGRIRRGKYRYVRVTTGQILLFKNQFVQEEPQTNTQKDDIDTTLAHTAGSAVLDFEIKREKLRKMQRENEVAEEKLISKTEIAKTHRVIFRSLFENLRQAVDKWKLKYQLDDRTSYEMQKDFDELVEACALELKGQSDD